MTNKKYIKGRKTEYEVIKVLKKQGYIAQRSAGSHKIDIFAWLDMNKLKNIHPLIDFIEIAENKPAIRFIMVASKFSERKLKEDIKHLDTVPCKVSRECWFWDITKEDNFDIRIIEDMG